MVVLLCPHAPQVHEIALANAHAHEPLLADPSREHRRGYIQCLTHFILCLRERLNSKFWLHAFSELLQHFLGIRIMTTDSWR